MAIRVTEAKKGMVIRYEGDLYQVTKYEHVTPGNWRAIHHLNLKHLKTGRQKDLRMNTSDQIEPVFLDARESQYLYKDSLGYNFMDNENYVKVSELRDKFGGLTLAVRGPSGPEELHPRGDRPVTRGEVVTRCRRPTAEELAGTPAHMRQETICEEGVVAPYHLRLAVNGQVLVDSTAPGSGGRGDRSMYLFRELRVATGTHRIVAELVRTDIGEDAGTTEETVSARNRRQRAIPRRLTVDTTVSIGEREVVLVTYDAERRRLTVVADQCPGALRRAEPVQHLAGAWNQRDAVVLPPAPLLGFH